MVSEDTMIRAVLEVKEKERSVRAVSEEFGIPRKTLGRYCAKYKQTLSQPTQSIESQEAETEPQPSIESQEAETEAQPMLLDQNPQPGGVLQILNAEKKPWDKFDYDK